MTCLSDFGNAWDDFKTAREELRRRRELTTSEISIAEAIRDSTQRRLIELAPTVSRELSQFGEDGAPIVALAMDLESPSLASTERDRLEQECEALLRIADELG